MTTLKKLAIRGAVWTIAGYGTSLIVRFGSNLILTRLLVPEFFGLMAVVNTLRVGLELFSDIGISQSIVNSKNGDDPSFLNTAWTLSIFRGLSLWLICLLLTWPMATFYNDDRFMWLIPIVGLSSVIDGFTCTNIHTLHRRINLGKLTFFDVIVQVLSVLTLLLLAYWSPSILALAIGVVAGSIYRMVGSYWLIPGHSNRFAWNQDAVKEILSFGKWIFVASGVTFLNEQSDRLILAKLLSFKLLGVYTIAYTLASIPRELIKAISHRVIFPALSNQIEMPRSILRSKILSQRRLILFAFATLLAVLVTIGDLIIATLYDSRYAEATWMMPILCCGIWISVLFYTMSPALLAIGKPLYAAQSNLAGFVTTGLGLPLAFFAFGTVGAIVLIALSDLPLYIVNLYGLWREKLSCFAQDIQMTAFFVGVLIVLLSIRNYLGLDLPIRAILLKI
ncbi:oligosaccharide flippase family protein [Nodularia sp. NIES-3585]|uniref:oligosaccharide flippase family protein n=1 Tax=Nodularia sp. NIES-3585 TaxID=1973477 RepID=UPI000B5C3939|nr:oligosaccharide flippase family protein [Nodularia sp. NIES-3585]GAX37567.1 polysaccharide biosynthesis protein [Nodularia sp. NIES-3585]